jgi:hypothetical protein
LQDRTTLFVVGVKFIFWSKTAKIVGHSGIGMAAHMHKASGKVENLKLYLKAKALQQDPSTQCKRNLKEDEKISILLHTPKNIDAHHRMQQLQCKGHKF